MDDGSVRRPIAQIFVRAVLAMLVFASLIWLFERQQPSDHAVEILLGGAVIAIQHYRRGASLRDPAQLARIAGFWLVVVLVPVAFIHLMK